MLINNSGIRKSFICIAGLLLLHFVFVSLGIGENFDQAYSMVQRVSVKSSIKDHADKSTDGSLANILSKTDPNKFYLVKLPGNKTYSLKQDLAIHPNITLKFQPGAVLNVAKKVVLELNCNIDSSAMQIFSGAGTITAKPTRNYWKGALGPQIQDVFPQWFGARGDGQKDDTVALQKAVDFACVSNVLSVCLGNSSYRLTKTLDLTNLRSRGKIARDCLRIYGKTGLAKGAKLIGDTGAGHAVVEISGIQFGEFENFTICSGKKNPSTIGLFMGVPKLLPQTQNNILHISISMHDDIKANDGFGTIALWNFAAEENTYRNVYFVANRPVILTAFNGFPNPAGPLKLEYKHSYVEQLKVHSLGMITFSGECFIQSVGGAPVFTTQCANTLKCENTYISGRGKGEAVFEVYGSLVNFNYVGVTEGRATFLNNFGTIENSNISVTYGGVVDKKNPLMTLNPMSRIINTTIKFNLQAAKNRNLFYMSRGKSWSSAKADSGKLAKLLKEGTVDEISPEAGIKNQESGRTALINSKIYTNLAGKYLCIPNVLKKNSKNSKIYSFDANIDLK